MFIFGCTNHREKPAEGLLSVNGTDLFVKTIGDGETLIVLHGGPGLSHDYFLPHLEVLSEEMKLVIFDQRGMGRSSVKLDSSTFSPDLLIEDIEALREKLGFTDFHLMGHSWGGVLAMQYAAAYPGSLKSLILCNSMPATPEFDELMFENFTRIFERQNMADLEPYQQKIDEGSRDIKIFERYIQLHFRPSFYDTSDVNQLNINLSENYFETQELLQYLTPTEEPPPLLPALENLHIPVLIIRGEIEAIPLESDQKLEQTLPNAELVNIPQAGHFPFIEKPEEFARIISGFIRQNT
jgi:proline iminopeptidase